MAIPRSAVVASAMLLAVTACAGDDNDQSGSEATEESTEAGVDADDTSTTQPTSTTEPTTTEPPATTTPTTSTEPTSTTEPSEDGESGEPAGDADDPPANTAPDGTRLLDFEFQPVPAGKYRVETIGAPFTIDVPDGWWVQPNSAGQFVITDPSSSGPGDRDIVMIRPSNLADPGNPSAPPEEQDGDWPVDDIAGWVDALIPGVVDGDVSETTLGGLEAEEFDVALTDEVQCGPDVCVGFATNRLVNGMFFDRNIGYRVWWIDGGDEAPIAINIGDGGDPAFTDRALAVLDSVSFESIGPNPIPADGNLWEAGIPTDVPAGAVTLPIGPGVSFEMTEPRFVYQTPGFGAVVLEGPGESDMFFTSEASDGTPIETVDDVIAALDRADAVTTEVTGTRDAAGYEATVLTFTGPPPGPDTAEVLGVDDNVSRGWRPPPDGQLWIMDTPDGVMIVSAEWFEPDFAEAAVDLATEILDTLSVGG